MQRGWRMGGLEQLAVRFMAITSIRDYINIITDDRAVILCVLCTGVLHLIVPHCFYTQNQLGEKQKEILKRIQEKENKLCALKEAVEALKVGTPHRIPDYHLRLHISNFHTGSHLFIHFFPQPEICAEQQGESREGLYWADSLHWANPGWDPWADQLERESHGDGDCSADPAAGAGDRWAEEEQRWAGEPFKDWGSHSLPTGNPPQWRSLQDHSKNRSWRAFSLARGLQGSSALL